MGCCQSNEVHDGKARNEEIENQIKRDKLNMRNEVKMLLLGKYLGVAAFAVHSNLTHFMKVLESPANPQF